MPRRCLMAHDWDVLDIPFLEKLNSVARHLNRAKHGISHNLQFLRPMMSNTVDLSGTKEPHIIIWMPAFHECINEPSQRRCSNKPVLLGHHHVEPAPWANDSPFSLES